MITSPGIIDVEASGFGRGSYPIEVGVALANGEIACFLIKPLPEWTHWTSEAEALHGISRGLLLTRGRPAAEIALELNSLLGSRVIYSDAWGFDSSWLALLHASCEIPASYRIDALTRLLSEAQQIAWADLKNNARVQLQLNRHRASADALVLQRAYRLSIERPLPAACTEP
ncbi:MAG: hypothetical protein EXR86_03010 [Gammaproteobacteria bacterium]|nr:hypothetical protein [Gammaproteobacteria bacterium]